MNRFPQELEYAFHRDETIRCRIKKGWGDAGRAGQYFGYLIVNNRKWSVVLFDDSDEPDLHKAESIEIENKKWTSAEHDDGDPQNE